MLKKYILSKYENIPSSVHKEEYRINCPFCGDTKFHGNVNFSKNTFHCYRCKWSPRPGGLGSTLKDFLFHAEGITLRGNDISRYEDGSIREDLRKVIMKLSETDLEDTSVNRMDTVDIPDCTKKILPGGGFLSDMAYDYLTSRFGREFSRLLIDRYDLHYCYDGEYFGRIIIPFRVEGRVVWFQARSFMSVAGPKYMNPKIRLKPIFNYDSVSRDILIITEGPFDAMCIGDGAVAVCGSSITDFQLKMMKKRIYPYTTYRKIILCFDDDEAGIRGSLRHRKDLLDMCDDLFVVQGLESDPAGYGREARSKVLDNIVRFSTEVEICMRNLIMRQSY